MGPKMACLRDKIEQKSTKIATDFDRFSLIIKELLSFFDFQSV